MSRAMIFDTGPLISLTMNNLIGLLSPLKEKYQGEFYICPAVFHELIQKPLTTRKYKFEALQILPYVMDGTIRLFENAEQKEKTQELLDIANNCFSAKGSNIKVVHLGEMEAIATALITGADTLVIDERTTRMLIENPEAVKERLKRKLHTHVEIDRDNVGKLKKMIGHLKVIRSFELGIAAYELGLLDLYMIKKEEGLDEIDNIKRSVLEGVLWAIKLAGCSVSAEEIDKALSIELQYP